MPIIGESSEPAMAHTIFNKDTLSLSAGTEHTVSLEEDEKNDDISSQLFLMTNL